MPRPTRSRTSSSAADRAAPPAKVAKRCATCARIRPYDPDDRFCFACGSDDVADACDCGRTFDYALGETGELHCPRCGKSLAGRVEGFEV